MPYKFSMAFVRLRRTQLALAAIVIAAGLVVSDRPSPVEAREPLGLFFGAGQTWKASRGYNCSNCVNPASHSPNEADRWGLDFSRDCGATCTSNSNLTMVFTGRLESASDFRQAGCRLIIRGNDNSQFMYIHLAYPPPAYGGEPLNSRCARLATGQQLAKGRYIPGGQPYSGAAHVHIQWCDEGMLGCADGVRGRPMAEGALNFPSRCNPCGTPGDWGNEAVRSSPPCTTRTDISRDGIVDIVDVYLITTHWGSPGGIADVNCDNNVDVLDISVLIDQWGWRFG